MIKKYLVFIFLILSMGAVYAETIEDTTIHVKIYNTTLEITNQDYSGNNKNTSIVINNGSLIDLQEFDFPILFIRNDSVDVSTVEKYAECIVSKGACDSEKAQFNMGWNNCIKDLNACNSDNNQSTKEQLSSQLNECDLDKKKLQIDLDAANKKFTDCDTTSKSTGNSKFIWAAGGGGLVFVIMMFVFGKWGNQGKDKSSEEFNPQRGY